MDVERLDTPPIPNDFTTILILLSIFIPLIYRILVFITHIPRRRQQRHNNHASLPTPLSTSPGTYYGLAVGEVDSDAENDDVDEITARELRRLHRSPSFHRYCRHVGITLNDLDKTASKLRLHRKLKALDPSTFWLLCRDDSKIGFESVYPSLLTTLTEYTVSTSMSIVALLSMCLCFYSYFQNEENSDEEKLTDTMFDIFPLSFDFTWMYSLCIIYLLAVYHFSWSQGRPSGGPFFSIWYEETAWGHRATSYHAFLANFIEAIYVLVTLGIGYFISLGLRAMGYQSIGERIMNVRVVVEKQIRLDSNG